MKVGEKQNKPIVLFFYLVFISFNYTHAACAGYPPGLHICLNGHLHNSFITFTRTLEPAFHTWIQLYLVVRGRVCHNKHLFIAMLGSMAQFHVLIFIIGLTCNCLSSCALLTIACCLVL